MKKITKNNYNLSVVIFSFNNTEGLTKCIDSFLNQTYAPHEILVIDNSSVENQTLVKQKNKNLRYYYNGNVNKSVSFSVARNLAMEMVCGDVVVLAEDDAYYSKNFLAAINTEFEKGSDIVCYRILPNVEFLNSQWKEIKGYGRIDMDFGLIDYGDENREIPSELIFNSFAFLKNYYFKSNGWGADGMTGDYFLYNSGGECTLVKNLVKAGANKFTYASCALMIHDKRELRLNNDYFFSRYFYWGTENAFYLLKDKKLGKFYFILLLRNIIKTVICLRLKKIHDNSYLDKELLLLIKSFGFQTMLFHFLFFKRNREIIIENFNRNWKDIDYLTAKKIKLIYIFNYKIHLKWKK